MTMWTHTIHIVLDATVPNIEAIASKIGRAFDPDSGGDKSFSRDYDVDMEGGITQLDTISTAAPCTAEFAAQAQYLMGHADRLFSATQHDYATRWPDLIAPTLEECGVFIAAITLFEVT